MSSMRTAEVCHISGDRLAKGIVLIRDGGYLLFADCAPGAVPAIGICYALDAMIDESINAQPEVYIEGGDHATLIHMGQSQFARLTMQAQRGRFSVRI